MEGNNKRMTLELPADILALTYEQAARLREVLARDANRPQDLPPARGQIWTTRSEEMGAQRAIVVLDPDTEAVQDGQSLMALPLSVELDNQAEVDLLIPREESPLGYAVMVETWNEVALLRSQLGRYLGDLGERQRARLLAAYRVRLGLDDADEELEEALGEPIWHTSDPRVRFQEEELAACDPLRRPLIRQMLEEDRQTSAAAAAVQVTQWQPLATVVNFRAALGRLRAYLSDIGGVAGDLSAPHPSGVIKLERSFGQPLAAALRGGGEQGQGDESQGATTVTIDGWRIELALGDAQADPRLVIRVLSAPVAGLIHVRLAENEATLEGVGAANSLPLRKGVLEFATPAIDTQESTDG